MRLFDLTLLAKGYDIKKAKALLQSIKSINEKDYNVHIENQKKQIVKHHLENNSFYKNFGRTIDINDWDSVPIITKKELQKPLKELLANNFNRKNCFVGKTSGSSGTPFVLAKNKLCHALTWANIMDKFSWYGIDFNISKQARFYGIPLSGFGYYKERFKDLLAKRYRFSVFDMSDKAFEQYLQRFESTTFDYINGYTSAIVQFAKFLKRRNVVLKSVCPTLKVCIVTSEMLFENDRQLLERQFGIKVVNEYGASELDLIAFERPDGKFQLNTETLFVEIIDSDGCVLDHGKEGRIIITALYNKAFPLIRYDIGDIGILSKDSSPKVAFLDKLTGRTNDIVHLPSGKKAAGLTFYYITKAIIEGDGAVKEFVIEQLSLTEFKITYVSDNELSKTKIEKIHHAMDTYLEKGLKISFERVEQIKRSKSGKLKQFTSNLTL